MRISSRSHFASENWRKLWHLLVVQSFAIFYYFTTQRTAVIVMVILTAVLMVFEIVRSHHKKLNGAFMGYLAPILRPKEATVAATHIYALFSCLVVILLFEKNIAITSIIFLAFGDVAAALMRRVRPTAKRYMKDLLAGAGCFLTCLAAGLILRHTGASLSIRLLVPGALAATIAELLPIPLDDNLTIPVLAAVAMTAFKLI